MSALETGGGGLLPIVIGRVDDEQHQIGPQMTDDPIGLDQQMAAPGEQRVQSGNGRRERRVGEAEQVRRDGAGGEVPCRLSRREGDAGGRFAMMMAGYFQRMPGQLGCGAQDRFHHARLPHAPAVTSHHHEFAL